MKDIIDLCCWWRMFRYDKNNPLVHFMDIRKLPSWSIKSRPNFTVDPDEIWDFRNIQHPDNTFKVVIMDPPHLRSLWDKSWMAMKYWKVSRERKVDMELWFKEAMRVLQDRWILIFKRNDSEISVSEIVKIFPIKPSIWQRTWKNNKTIRLIYIK